MSFLWTEKNSAQLPAASYTYQTQKGMLVYNAYFRGSRVLLPRLDF